MQITKEPLVGLKNLRKTRGLSLRALSRLADVNPSTLLYLEEGGHKPKQGTLEKVAKALSVDVEDLSGDPPEHRNLLMMHAPFTAREGRDDR